MPLRAQHVELGAGHVGGNGVDVEDHPPPQPSQGQELADVPTEVPPDTSESLFQ